MLTTHNGKRVSLPDNATIDELKRLFPQYRDDDILVQQKDGSTKAASGGEKVQSDAQYWPIPKIVKGTSGLDRLNAELALLKTTAKGHDIRLGSKRIGNVKYTVVRVKNVRLNTRKFKVAKTDLLFLLPAGYPEIPPLGCYLNYKWSSADQSSADHHFTFQAHYGAPYLGDEGWYWYCVGLGGGFDASTWGRSWKPAASPEAGHNLATLFLTARHAINSD